VITTHLKRFLDINIHTWTTFITASYTSKLAEVIQAILVRRFEIEELEAQHKGGSRQGNQPNPV